MIVDAVIETLGAELISGSIIGLTVFCTRIMIDSTCESRPWSDTKALMEQSASAPNA